MKKILNSKLVAFGDSITEGNSSLNDNNNWTDIITSRFNLKLINSGVSGETSTQGISRIKESVFDHKPDFVVINFGMNDKTLIGKNKPKVDIVTYKNNITQIVTGVKAIGAVPILVTTNFVIEGDRNTYYYSRHDSDFYLDVDGAQCWLDKYIQVIRDLGKELDVHVVDIRTECEKYDRYDFLRSLKNCNETDGVHPSKLGAEVYAKSIGDLLEEYFS